MKTSSYHSFWKRSCLLLLVFNTLSSPDARCELPLKRTLGAIKQKVGLVIRKIGSGIAQDSPKANQRSASDDDLRYGPPPMSSSQLASPSGPSLDQGDTSRNAPEVIYSAPTGQPDLILRRPQSSTTGPAVTSANEPSQRVDSNKMPPLRELPMDGPSESPTSPSNAVDQVAKNPAATQAAPATTSIIYARPVPGHPGFVYPPGVKEDLKNMLDVRGCASGEKMRDPRTGNVFFVP